MLFANSPGYHLQLNMPMRGYQLRASHKLFTGTPLRDEATGYYMWYSGVRDGTNIHIDPGLGKTVIALTAIVDWFRWGVCNRPVLVVAPIKVCEAVWRQEALKWTHTRHLRFGLLRGNERDRAFTLARAFNESSQTRYTDVILINPELLKWLIKYLRGKWEFFDALIIDDVPLKDPKSQQFKVMSNYGVRTGIQDALGFAIRDENGKVIRIPPHRFKRAAKMTGTPSTAGLHNVWAPNYLMDHGARLFPDYNTFEGRFFHKAQEVADHIFKVDINAEEAEARPLYVARDQAPERIHELIADITIELNAEDYGVLPKTIGDASKGEVPLTHLHRVELPGALRADYDRLEKEAVLELEKDVLMAQNGGAKSMMCWQIANGFVYSTDDFGRKEARILHDEKLHKMVELIDRLNTNMLIPYWFKEDFARITARLQKEGMAFATFKKGQTERIIDQFKGGYTPILLIHPQSAGHGLDGLQFGAHTLLWYTWLWSLEKYLQTNARLARGGQSQVVGIHHIMTTKTTDELMAINLRQNGNTQQRFRSALREYQRIRGIDYITQNPLEGLL